MKRESAYLADVMAAVTDDDKTKRPSVEALLHNLFAYTYVLHVHPTLVNGLTCGKGAQRFVCQTDGRRAVPVIMLFGNDLRILLSSHSADLQRSAVKFPLLQ